MNSVEGLTSIKIEAICDAALSWCKDNKLFLENSVRFDQFYYTRALIQPNSTLK